MNKDIIKLLFPTGLERVENGRCPFCNASVEWSEFRDELSKREFRISGMCQECQDKTFDSESDD